MKGKAKGGKGASGTFSLWVQVKPRAARDRLRGFNNEGFLEIHVTARPVRGEANKNCCLQLSRALGVPRSRVVLETGQGSRRKRFRIEGISKEQGEARLERALRKSEA